MSRGFIDTNIGIYYYTTGEPRKREVAGSLFLANDRLTISTQVLSETCNVLRKKFHWQWYKIEPIIKSLRRTFEVAIVTEITIERAIDIATRTNTPYFDSLMVASAIESNCSTLYSEDFQDGQEIDGVRIVNPFLL